MLDCEVEIGLCTLAPRAGRFFISVFLLPQSFCITGFSPSLSLSLSLSNEEGELEACVMLQ